MGVIFFGEGYVIDDYSRNLADTLDEEYPFHKDETHKTNTCNNITDNNIDIIVDTILENFKEYALFIDYEKYSGKNMYTDIDIDIDIDIDMESQVWLDSVLEYKNLYEKYRQVKMDSKKKNYQKKIQRKRYSKNVEK